jgi:uncharacterized membrane protein YccC
MATATGRAKVRDPGHRALRKATRLALVLPLALLVALNLPYVKQGALLTAFSCLAQIIFADFGGPLKRRFLAYVGTTLAGVPLLIVGSLASPNRIASVITVAVVALLVGVLGVLRGVVGAAQTVLLLATVLALTATDPATLGPDVAAWIFGGLVAAVSAVALWPMPSTQRIQRSLADVLEALADVCEARWVSLDEPALALARQQVTDRLVALHKSYDGDLQRPAGVTTSDRSLAELVDEVGRLRYLQSWEDLTDHRDAHLQRVLAEDVQQVAAALRACAGRLRGDRAPLSTQPLTDLRARSLDEMSQWVADHRGAEDVRALREQIDDAFPMRITTLVAARIMDLTIAVDPRHGDTPSEQPSARLDVPRSERIRANLSWESPWMRNALRTAVALAISVAVAKSVPLEHPFWIVLGTLSALRFDALGTGRTAWQAIVGTTAGVLVSAGVVYLVGPDTTVWWLLLPVALFAAAYTPSAVNYAVGQASFSFVVIVLFSVMTPPGMDLPAARWLDVMLGLAVSLVVSLLMWPRGVIETLYRRLDEAMTAAADFYVASGDWIADGAIDENLLAEFRLRSSRSLDRAREAVDLAIAQRPPQAVAVQKWTALANTIRHVDFAARLAPRACEIVRNRGGQAPIPPPLVGPMLTATSDVRDRLTAAAEQWTHDRPVVTDDSAAPSFTAELPQFTVSGPVVAMREAIDAYLAGPGDWEGTGPDPRPAVVTWLTDWNAVFDRGAQILARAG